jgi:hypothetical protein
VEVDQGCLYTALAACQQPVAQTGWAELSNIGR